MAGKEIDRDRARGAVAVIKLHPVMVLFAISPALILAIGIGWLTHPIWGVLFFVVATLAGGLALVRKR